MNMKLHSTIFEGQFPNLISLTLRHVHPNLCDFNFPSLTRFDFETGTDISFWI
jgi:hypothetical protein